MTTLGYLAAGLMAATTASGGSTARVLQLSGYKDPDLGARLRACVKDLPPEGGTCDGRTDDGPQVVSSTTAIKRNNVQLLLPAGNIRFVRGASLALLGNGITVVGLGKQATTFTFDHGSGLRIGDATTVARKWAVQGVGLVSGAEPQESPGLVLENAREGRVQDVLIYGFTKSAGILVKDNCWTILLDDLTISTNHIGLSYVGSQVNAWSIRSSLFVMNGVGISFDMGKGTGQGVSITDGTHFEANTIAGLWFRSGDLQEIGISNAYVEAFAGQDFVRIQGDGAPILVRAFDYSAGQIWSKNKSPFYFAARQSDFIRATIRGVYAATSESAVPIATFVGPTASGAIIGGSVSTSRNLDARVFVSNDRGGRGVVSDGKSRFTASGTVSFGAWHGGDCQDENVTVRDVRPGSMVALGLPVGLARIGGVQFTGFVSSPGIVTIRGCKSTPGGSVAPNREAVRIEIWGDGIGSPE